MLRRLFIACLMGLVMPGAATARDINIITYNTVIASSLQVVSSVPADNAILDASPQTVIITFTQNINPDPGKSTLTVYDPYNSPVSGVSVKLKGGHIKATLPPLLNGTYRVEWQTDCECQDGTALSGVLHFTVQ